VRRRAVLSVGVVGLAAAGGALGVVLSASAADPLHTVSNRGRPVALTAAMRRDFRESGYDASRIRLYLMAVREPRRLYRFTTRKYGTCYGMSYDGGRSLDSYGCPWRPLGHPDRVVDDSAYSGPPMEGRTAANTPHVCNEMPLFDVWGWTVDAVKEMRILDERGRIAAVIPVRDNVYSILPGQLPTHPCSLVAIDSRGRVLWSIRDSPPEF
jgi:hypothetical protein